MLNLIYPKYNEWIHLLDVPHYEEKKEVKKRKSECYVYTTIAGLEEWANKEKTNALEGEK